MNLGIRDFNNFTLKAKNNQQAVDFIYSRIINDDKSQVNALKQILKHYSIREYIEKREDSDSMKYNYPIIKRFVDNGHYDKMYNIKD